MNYYQKGQSEVIEIFQLKDLEEKAKEMKELRKDNEEFKQMEKELKNSYIKFQSMIDKQRIVLGDLNIKNEQIEETIGNIVRIMERGDESDVVELVKEAIVIVPKIKQLEADFYQSIV